MTAHPDAAVRRPSSGGDKPKHPLQRLVNAFSLVTMAMTVPQAVAVWHAKAEGVSVLSWGTYLVSACLWLVYGLRERDKTVWVPCLGWIVLDAAIVLGIVLHG